MENLDLRDWLFVIGVVGFGLASMIPIFWCLYVYAPIVGEEAKSREVSWLTPPLDMEDEKDEETKDELVTVGRRVHSRGVVDADVAAVA